MSAHSPELVQKQIKLYVRVFLALAILTVVTVGVSYIHMPLGLAIVVALFVASIKGTLVAAYFMHLSSEKKIITSILILTVFFVIFLLLYPSWHAQ